MEQKPALDTISPA